MVIGSSPLTSAHSLTLRFSPSTSISAASTPRFPMRETLTRPSDILTLSIVVCDNIVMGAGVQVVDVQDRLFGVRIQRERELAGMRGEDVAAKMGISPSILAHYERGHRRMPQSRVDLWCKAVGITKERLLTMRTGDLLQHRDHVKTWLKDWRDLDEVSAVAK